MKFVRFALFVALLSVVSGCVGTSKVGNGTVSVQSEIETLMDRWAAYFKSKDVEKIVDLYALPFILDRGVIFETREEAEAIIEASLQEIDTIESMTVYVANVSHSGDNAMAVVTLILRAQIRGVLKHVTSVSELKFVKDGTRWRIKEELIIGGGDYEIPM